MKHMNNYLMVSLPLKMCKKKTVTKTETVTDFDLVKILHHREPRFGGLDTMTNSCDVIPSYIQMRHYQTSYKPWVAWGVFQTLKYCC